MKLVAVPNGPLMLAETGRLVDAEGRDVASPVYLCRCGASRHKPYCDGSHGAVGFKAEGAQIRSARREGIPPEARKAAR
jgi:CDGSH-type Zn-finger protein